MVWSSRQLWTAAITLLTTFFIVSMLIPISEAQCTSNECHLEEACKMLPNSSGTEHVALLESATLQLRSLLRRAHENADLLNNLMDLETRLEETQKGGKKKNIAKNSSEGQYIQI